MSGMMLKRLGALAATSSSRRKSGDSEYNRKKAKRQKADQNLMQRRRARVAAARSTLSSPESDASKMLRHAHQYGAAVSKMNRSRIGKPNRLKKINRYPNPEPKRRVEKSLVEFDKPRNDNNNNDSGGGGGKQEEQKNNGEDPTRGGWGTMYRYQAIQMKKEQKDEKVQALKTRNELKEYLDNQVTRKNKYFVNKKEETAYWKKKNIDMHAEWKQSIKSDQKKVLAKNLEIKKARQIQLDQLEARRMKERMILKKEDNVMMSRQKKEKQRVAREKIKKLKQQEISLARVKVENEKAQAHKAKLIQEKWAYEARLDKEYKEVLDKQERKRAERIAEIKRKQDSLETIGLQAQTSMADQLAADAARAKRDQLILRKREDIKAAGVIAKKEKMKNDMIKSIDQAIKLKEQMRRKRAVDDAAFSAKLKRLNNIELERMDHVDDGREARKREWAKTLDVQVAELRARKKKEGASMSATEIRFNRIAMGQAEHYMKQHPPPPPREIEIKTQPW